MLYEIEIKAWVKDFNNIEKKLRADYQFINNFLKEDIYFIGSDNPSKMFRLRKNNGEKTVTYKEKKIINSVEVNKEKEFNVSDEKHFTEFAFYSDYKIYIKKIKKGLAFRGEDNLILELSHIDKLGDFLEVEMLLEFEDDILIKQAQKKVKEVLLSIIEDEKLIESRYYIDLLKEL